MIPSWNLPDNKICNILKEFCDGNIKVLNEELAKVDKYNSGESTSKLVKDYNGRNKPITTKKSKEEVSDALNSTYENFLVIKIDLDIKEFGNHWLLLLRYHVSDGGTCELGDTEQRCPIVKHFSTALLLLP